MKQDDLMLYAVVGLIVWAIILSAIISSATRSKKIERQLRIQTDLLAAIGKKQGLTDEEIKRISDKNKV